MANRIFSELLNERIAIFKNAFLSVSRNAFFDEQSGELIHSGEFGTYREAICIDFLKFLVPRILAFDTGFVISAQNEVGTQCDVIIFDNSTTPLIQSGARQRFFPVESVCAIGEIKSVVSKDELRKAVMKLCKIKAMREAVAGASVVRKLNAGEYNPIGDPFDQIFTFIICEKLNFKVTDIAEEITSFYSGEVPARHYHNMILSIEDGLLSYAYSEKVVWAYPSVKDRKFNPKFQQCKQDSDIHIQSFATDLFTGTFSNTILLPDIARYMFEPHQLANNCDLVNTDLN